MVYMFQCDKCSARFEVVESLAEHEMHREKCPHCGTSKVHQRYGKVHVKTARKS